MVILLLSIDPQRIADMFNIFNTSGDGSMSIQEFNEMYEKWIKKIIQPTSAFVIVDVQNDFINGSRQLRTAQPSRTARM